MQHVCSLACHTDELRSNVLACDGMHAGADWACDGVQSGTGKLLMVASSCKEAVNMLEALEKGVHGVLLHTQSPAEVSAGRFISMHVDTDSALHEGGCLCHATPARPHVQHMHGQPHCCMQVTGSAGIGCHMPLMLVMSDAERGVSVIIRGDICLSCRSGL